MSTSAPSDAVSAATRLCSACGLCCNGVMFHTVRMQPSDSPSVLSALGLKLKRKKGQRYLLQPCPAFCGSHCSIYDARPARCRLFECRQLQGVIAGEIPEESAMERIGDVQRRVGELIRLMDLSGRTDPKKPLSKRYEKILAVPLDASADPAELRLREDLTRAFEELDAILDQEFRVGVPKDESVDLGAQ